MNGRDDIDALAAEYVLGTLDRAERADLAARRLREPRVDAAIAAWEGRLGPLHELAPPVAPPSDLLPGIRRRIAALGRGADGEEGTIAILSRSRGRWRAAAGAMTAIAAALLVFAAIREIEDARMPTSYVAVLQKDAASPAFLLTVDMRTKMVSVRRVAAKPMPKNSYELWLIHESLPAPRSLGLISGNSFTEQPTLAAYQPDVFMDATFAVTIEPEGGAPAGIPTGPVVYAGKLTQATK